MVRAAGITRQTRVVLSQINWKFPRVSQTSCEISFLFLCGPKQFTMLRTGLISEPADLHTKHLTPETAIMGVTLISLLGRLIHTLLMEMCEWEKCPIVLGRTLNVAFSSSNINGCVCTVRGSSGWAWLWSFDQSWRAGRTQPVLMIFLLLIMIGSLAKHSLNLQLQLLTFHLVQQFSHGSMGAKVKRQSLDCVTKVLFKGDQDVFCSKYIPGSAVVSFSLFPSTSPPEG